MPLTPARRLLRSSFNPLSLSPLIWLTADPAYCFTDDGVTPALLTEPIKRWVNRGSLGGFFTQATLGNRPTLQFVNGKYVVRTLGQTMTSSGIDMSAVTGATLSFLTKKNTGINNDEGGYAYFGTGTNTLTNYSDTNLYDTFGSTARKTVLSPGPNWEQWSRYIVTTKANEWTARFNGSEIFTTATNTVGWQATITLFSGNVASFNADTRELIVYPALAASQIAQVEAYLTRITP